MYDWSFAGSSPRSSRHPAGVVARAAHVVTARDHVDPELVGAPQERAELDLAVAAGARVRRPTRLVLRGEVREHGPLEVVRSGRRSRTGTRRSERSRPRPAWRSGRSTRDRPRRDARGACASRARRTPARGAGRRRPRNRRRRTSRPARRACDEASSDRLRTLQEHGSRSRRPYRGEHARGAVRRPHRRLAVVPARGTGRRPGGHARR